MVTARNGWRITCVGFIFCLFIFMGPAIAAEKPPIKVGLALCYTGIAPLQAKGVSDGAELAFDEVGRKAGGRTIQLFKEDTRLSGSSLARSPGN